MVELLSPVGNKEMLYQAIHNGADAVYLAGKMYGARKFSENFSEGELLEVVQYSHLYGVKVYVTVNTIVYEKEVEDFISYVKYLYKIGVDALIMQDIGMINLVHQILPDFDIHASTQMHNYSVDNIDFLKSLGVSRVVFARETELKEIKKVKDIETEVFIHGALCVSYSGCCLFSSLIGNRSGNRGECAGSCRLKYELYENDKKINTSGDYLLSTKELSCINNLEDILNSNITSLKIEGRMKSPYYVGFVTRLYRRIIDAYLRNEKYTITDEDIYNLKVLYNREFTKGFINNEIKKDIVNIKSPNHLGVVIGKVVSFDKDKILIKLNHTLNQGDGIRFTINNKGLTCNYLYDKKMNLVSSASEYVYLKNSNLINEYSDVVKTFDIKLKEELSNLTLKKIEISFKVIAKANKNLKIIISDGINEESIESKVIEQAINKATTKEEIKEKLNRLGNTPFICSKIDFDIDDNLFIPLSLINESRRQLVDRLIEKRKNSFRELKEEKYANNKSKVKTSNFNLNVLVRNKEQLDTCLEYNVSNIYVDDFILYLEYVKKYNNIYYYVPRVNNIKDLDNNKLVVSDTASINKFFNKNKLVGSTYFNCVNSYSINYLFKYLDKVCLSVESDFDNTKSIIENYENRYGCIPNIEKVIYGRIDLMIMKYCPLNKLINTNKICKICKNNNRYYLKDRKNEFYPILNHNCITTILHYKNIDELDKIDKYKKIGINNYLVIFYDEDKEKVKNILKLII